jgi:uncharacterized protein (TIGR00369 family)
MSGLESLRAMIAAKSELPPIARTLGLTLVEVSEGTAVFECSPGEHLLNPFGLVHGGIALMLADSAAGCAVQTRLPAGVGYSSIETKVNFTRPILAGSGAVRATGRVLSLGRRIATAEALVHLADGRLAAHGTSTIMILNGSGRARWEHWSRPAVRVGPTGGPATSCRRQAQSAVAGDLPS